MTKKFNITISEQTGKTIEIKAETEEQAIQKVMQGNWGNGQVVNENIIDWVYVDCVEVA